MWKKLLPSLFIILITLGAIMGLFGPRPPINQSNYERIKEGIRQEELETILQIPPGDYRSSSAIQYKPSTKSLKHLYLGRRRKWLQWQGNEGFIRVMVDAKSGLVLEKDYRERKGPPTRPIARLVWECRRLWKHLSS